MKSISVLLFTTLACNVFACSCYGPQNFCETIGEGYQDIIVLAVKKADQAHGMQVNILEVIEGIENRSQVTVWGDNGLLCRWYTNNWDVGDTLVLALDLVGPYAFEPQEDSTDYIISICGTYVLSYDNGRVVGDITPTQSSMSYSSFKDLTQTCLISSAPEPSIVSELTVFPNPAKNEVYVQFDEVNISSAEFRLYNLKGQLVLQNKRALLSSGSIMLPVQDIVPGLYTVTVQFNEAIVTKRLLIY